MENLPVILLKGLVLIPDNDIRLEFDDELSKSLIDIASLFHQNNLLVINNFNNSLNDIDELPNIGIIGIIKNKLELPNGKTRITITGKMRVGVSKYFYIGKDLLEAKIKHFLPSDYDVNLVSAYIRKIYFELEDCIKTVPTISNSIMALIDGIKTLGSLTDVIVSYLPITKKRLCEYANCIDEVVRSEMLIYDIVKEKQIYEIEKDIDNKIKKEIDNNQKEYILKEKLKVIKEEIGESTLKEEDVKKLKLMLDNLDAVTELKSRISNEITRYANMSDLSPELSVVRKYLDWLLNLPWNVETHDLEDLNEIEIKLKKSHFGLDEVKLRIIEYLAVKKMSKDVNTPIICLVGPPGVGKTTLASSIAKSINRKFVKISVAGISNESEILGHVKSYIGASPGKIITGLRQAQSKNPVFLIDEIDKMTKGYNGDPASCLLEVLDYNQNRNFRDNYIEESFDLSKVMFILTANNIEDIPLPLKDRLEIIKINGYTEYEKVDIAKNYLVPKACKRHGIDRFKLSEEVLTSIIKNYTKESGVRDLERNISKIIRKVTTFSIKEEKRINDIVITLDNLKNYLGKEKYNYKLFYNNQVGIVNGLSCTSYGGDILPIEVNYYKGKGKLILTGSLGNVIKESAMIALSYIKANYKKFNIRYDDLINNDIHIHIPSGSVIKEGPSAGVALTTSLISAFSNLKIKSDIAMTGEITLRGNILAVGGIKDKVNGAIMNNITKMFVPYDNLKDIDDLPDNIKNKLKYIPVRNYLEIYEKIGDL